MALGAAHCAGGLPARRSSCESIGLWSGDRHRVVTGGRPPRARADTTITGEKLGAFFQITVPDDWNGDLVINNHGFDFNPPAAEPGPRGAGPADALGGLCGGRVELQPVLLDAVHHAAGHQPPGRHLRGELRPARRRDPARRQPRRHRHRAGHREARRERGRRVSGLRRAGGQPLVGRRDRPAARLRRGLRGRARRHAPGRRHGPAVARLPARALGARDRGPR